MNATTLASFESNDIIDALSKFDKNALRSILKQTDSPSLDHLPGSKGIPLLGNIYPMARHSHLWIEEQYQKFGPIFKFKALHKEMVFMVGPDANKLMYQNENQTFSNFLAYGPTIKNILDDNVLSLDFAYHKTTRKTLQAAFKRQSIEGHIALMNPFLRGRIEQDWPTNKTVRSMDHVRKMLLDTGAKVFLGLDVGKEADKLNKAFVDIVAGGAVFIRAKQIPFLPYAKALKGREIMNEFVYSNIKKRRTAAEPGRDIFSQLCNAKDESGNHFTDQEICNQIVFVLFAAHDTTASALSSTFYALASDQAWQDELREEMFSLNKVDLAFDDFDRLEKTGWTLKEALRMYPPAPFVPRYALKDFNFGGYRVPANTTCFGYIPFTHFMPEYWTNPKQFDAKRFSPERAEEKKEFYQYVPFGGGAHKCLGLHFAQTQGKLFLFNLLKNYRITKNPSFSKYNFNYYPLTFPTDGLPLKFSRI